MSTTKKPRSQAQPNRDAPQSPPADPSRPLVPLAIREQSPHGVNVIVAAGGLLTKGGVTPVMAIVHRPKYDDWSLPKGKLESGETAEQAALREITEETGCRARLGRFAGLTQYPLETGLKLVLFWHMEVEAEDTSQLGDDVDQVLWLSPQAAALKLTHDAEKTLVQREFAGWRPALLRGWKRIAHRTAAPWGRSLPNLRLEAAIVSFRAQLEWRRHRSPDTSGFRPAQAHPPIWFLICSQLLTAAESALHNRERDKAWACFEAAQRMEVFGFDQHESRARLLALRAEARDKIAGWRKHAIEQILPDSLLANDSPTSDTPSTHAVSPHPAPQTGPASPLAPKPALARLQVALAHGLQVRDEHFQNNYFKLAMVNRQIRLLIYCLLLVLLFVLGMAHSGSLPPMLEPPQYGFSLYLAVVLFGAMGGVLSVLLTLGNAPSDSRIPEAISTNRGYTLRPLLGAAAALVTLLFLASGMLNLGGMTHAKALTIAFVAGFSERFLLSAVNALPIQKTADKSP